MPKTKVTPCAKHPDRTQQFLDATQIALETFEDEISSLTEDIRKKVYRNYVKAYREALVPVWNLAHFADIRTVLETVTDKNMNEITTMAERLKPTSPRPKAISDKATIPDLKTITTAMLQKFPGEKLPESSICEKIGNVFSLLSTTHTAYSEAAHGLAELATLLTPQQYTLLLTATITPVDRSGSNDITIVHTTSTQAGIEYGRGTHRNYELYETQSPPQPRFRISDGLR